MGTERAGIYESMAISRCSSWRSRRSEEEIRSAGQPFFRSYAGMTRIRFKGPAHRRLSAVRHTPRNGFGLGRGGTGCQADPALIASVPGERAAVLVFDDAGLEEVLFL